MAPMALAICRAVMETPPVPCTNTVSPAFSCPFTTKARQAVRPEVVIVAACAWLQPCGAWVKAFTERTTYSERSEEHTSELQSRFDLVCRHLLENKKRRNH